MRVDVKRCAVRPGGARVPVLACLCSRACARPRARVPGPSHRPTPARVLACCETPGPDRECRAKKKPAFRRVCRASGSPLIVDCESDSCSQRDQR